MTSLSDLAGANLMRSMVLFHNDIYETLRSHSGSLRGETCELVCV